MSVELPAVGALEMGQPMTEARLTALGGIAPHAWALTGPGKLPTGLTLDPARGTIRGKPEALGSFSLIISVKDANGSVVIARMTLEVKRTNKGK